MQKQKENKRDGNNPRLGRLQRGASALGQHGEGGKRAEEDQRRIGGQKNERGCGAGDIPRAFISLHDRLPVTQQRHRPERHRQDRRSKIGRWHRQQRDADHQQHGNRRMRRPEQRAAEREHAPIGYDHAELRQEVNAKQSGDPKRYFAEPISKRRTNTAGEPEFMTDGEKLGEIAWRREIEHCRDHEPNEGLRQRGEPEHQLRP